VSRAIIDIDRERQRQIMNGFNSTHDDQHVSGELVQFAMEIAGYYAHIQGVACPSWIDSAVDKVAERCTGDNRQLLVVAAALLQAEIERIDRLAENRDPS